LKDEDAMLVFVNSLSRPFAQAVGIERIKNGVDLALMRHNVFSLSREVDAAALLKRIGYQHVE
jgi:hypothetical protein